MNIATLPLRCPRSHRPLHPVDAAELEQLRAVLPLSTLHGVTVEELGGALRPEGSGEEIFYPCVGSLYRVAPEDACRWPEAEG